MDPLWGMEKVCKPRRIKRKDGDAQQVKEINKTENVIAMSDCNIKNQTLKLL